VYVSATPGRDQGETPHILIVRSRGGLSSVEIPVK